MLAQWLQFSNKAPKGFGKFFDKNDKKDGPSSAESGEKKTKPQPAPARKPTPSPAKKDDKNMFEFKFDFGNSSKNSGSSGGSSGNDNNNKEKLYILAGLVGGAALSLYMFNEMAYEEIGWQEFVTKWVASGEVFRCAGLSEWFVIVLLFSAICREELYKDWKLSTRNGFACYWILAAQWTVWVSSMVSDGGWSDDSEYYNFFLPLYRRISGSPLEVWIRLNEIWRTRS